MKIKRISLDDIREIGKLQPQDWQDNIVPWFRFYYTHPFCYPVKVIYNGGIIAVGSAIYHLGSAWLGHIIVQKDFRRNGIGYMLTNHLINHLFNKNKTTISLIATEQGKPLYEKLGFESVIQYSYYQGKSIKNYNGNEYIFRATPEDYKAICELDIKAYGEDRTFILKQFIDNAFVFKNKGKIEGYFLRNFGEGSIVAINPLSGIGLLKYKFSIGQFRTVLPSDNKSGIEYLSKYHQRLDELSTRMILGKRLSQNRGMIYGRAGGFIG